MENKGRHIGRFMYIEPTNPNLNLPDNAITYPYDDYSMGVNLEVVIPSRTEANNGNGYTMIFSSDNGTITFFGGSGKEATETTPSYLSTNFTDVTYTNIGRGNKECLGIETINITYTSWFYPQVTIKFVDVRGMSLFMPQEKALRDTVLRKNTDITQIDSGSFFKALFSFPYPTFNLTVKGFYGKPVTYKLMLANFNADFDANTGNFIATVDFIGKMYGVYTEIPLIYAAIAPFIDNKKYWKENQKGNNRRFVYDNGTDILTFDDLYESISNALGKAEKKKKEQEEQLANEIGDAQIRNNKVSELIASYPFKELRTVTVNDNKDNKRQSETRYFVSESDDIYTNVNTNTVRFNVNDINGFFSGISAFCETYPEHRDLLTEVEDFKSKSGRIFCKYIVEPDGAVYEYRMVGNGYPPSVGSYSKVSRFEGIDNGIYGDEVKIIKKNYPELKNFDGKRVFIHHMNNKVVSKLNEITENDEKKKNDETKKIEQEYYKEINEELGFNLTIGNVFRTLFAHLDCFMNEFQRRVDTIKNEDRRIEKFNFTDFDFDRTGVKNVPPFPLCIEEKSDGDTKKEEVVWPERDSGTTTIEETKFVEELINAAQKYKKRGQELIEELSNEQREENATNDINANERHDFVPLTLYDFNMYNTKTYPNPYKYIAMSNITQKEKAELISAVFSLRCWYVLYTMNNIPGNGYEKIGKLYQYISYVEALNIYRAFGNKLDNELKRQLRIYDEPKSNETARDFIDSLEKPDKKPWNVNGNPLFNFKNNDIRTVYALDSEKFPKLSNFVDVKNVFDNSKYFISLGQNDMSDISCTLTNTSDTLITLMNDYIDGAKAPNNIEQFKIGNMMDNLKYDNDDISKEYNRVNFRNEQGKNVKKFSDINENCYIVKDALVGKDKKVLGLVEGKWEELGIFSHKDCGNWSNEKLAYAFLFSIPTVKSRNKEWHNRSTTDDLYFYLLREGAYYWGLENSPFNFLPSNEYVPVYDRGALGGSNGKTDKGIDGFTTNKDNIDALLKWSDLSEVKPTEARKERLKNLFTNFVNSNYFKELTKLKAFVGKNNSDEKTSAIDTAQKIVVSLLTRKCSLIDTSRPISDSGKISLQNSVKDAITHAFYLTQKKLYGIYKTKDEDEDVLSSEPEELDTGLNKPYDLLLSTYLNLKDMYDKFFCTLDKGIFTFDGRVKDSSTEFGKFHFIDTYYNDISDKLLVNGIYLRDFLQSVLFGADESMDTPEKLDKKMSIYEFMSLICEKNNMTFLALPQKFGLTVDDNGAKEIEDMFKPHSYNEAFMNNFSDGCYIGLYSYKPSEHLDIRDDTRQYGYKNDSFDIIDDPESELPVSLSELTTMSIPAFGVTFAKQNQSLFKNVSLTTRNQQVTEQSIAATMDISARKSTGPRETNLYGQDLYRVYSNYAYQCTVEMMGNVQIMPLMYFQLNNIPMWHGAYMIISVEHNIAAGEISTKFTGVRVNKNSIPLVQTNLIFTTPEGKNGVIEEEEESVEEEIIERGTPSTEDEEIVDRGPETPESKEEDEVIDNGTVEDGGSDYDVSDDEEEEEEEEELLPLPAEKNFMTDKRAVTEAIKRLFLGCKSMIPTSEKDHKCSLFAYNLATFFVNRDFYNKNDKKCSAIHGIGNANNPKVQSYLKSIGYKEVTFMNNLKHSELSTTIENIKPTYGDVLIYYSDRKLKKKGSVGMHVQFYVGDAYRKDAEGYDPNVRDFKQENVNKCGWACDKINNYGSAFVYRNKDKYGDEDARWTMAFLRYVFNGTASSKPKEDKIVKPTAEEQRKHKNAVLAMAKTKKEKKVIDFIRECEGSWSDDANDAGGCTLYGISIKTYKAYYGNNMQCKDLRQMTPEEWYNIFKKGFYDKANCGEINNDSIALLVCDMCWGSGTVTAARRIQKTLGCKVDGHIGDETLAALNANDREVFDKLWNMRKSWINELVKNNPTNKNYEKGWMSRLNKIKFEP